MRITIYKLHSFDSGQIVSQVGQIGRQIGPSTLLVSLIGAPQMPHSIEKNYFIVYKYASQ